MARYTGPKHKLARREGVNILEKVSKSLDRRINIIPGFHSKRGRRKFSEYGQQLREKQKTKRIYGIFERQFRNYIREAQKSKSNTEEILIQLLETRLDNIVYKLGFAHSRPMARQFVSHNHVLVNGKKVNIPSYHVKEGDVVVLGTKILRNEGLKKEIEENSNIASYLEKKGEVGRLVRMPKMDDVNNPVDYQLVIEYYSR